MRDPNRIDPFLAEIGNQWKKHPDFRFCQLMANFAAYMGKDIFYLEDNDFLQKFNEMIEKNS